MILTGRSCVLDLAQMSSPVLSPGVIDRAGPTTPRAVLRERSFLGKIMLRLDPRDERQAAAARAAVAMPLPAPGLATMSNDLAILSLSRDAYLVVTPALGQYHWSQRLRTALSAGQAAVVDVSSGYATFQVSGAAAIELLYRGCSALLEPPAFALGNCMTTKVGKITTIIHRTGNEPGFNLHVARSLAVSLWTWLTDVGRDCALVIAGGDSE
jgi:sarcosine oxidase, subunit gamma